jgi:hypothetical protein
MELFSIMKKRIILTLLTSILLIAIFQNCQKKKLSDSEECVAQGMQDCNPYKKIIEKLDFDAINSSVILYGDRQEPVFKVNMATNEVINLINGKSCKLSGNTDWVEIKSMYIAGGICRYVYPLAPGEIRCMSISVPFGAIEKQNSRTNTELAGATCGDTHNTVCGDRETQGLFLNAFERLKSELSANRGCD